MSKIAENPVKAANYCLEKWIEDENATYEDASEYVWQYDQRMKILEPLIRDTARFSVELLDYLNIPSSFDEGDVVLECIRGTYDAEQAKCWIYSHFHKHAAVQANAIYVLFSTSFYSQGFQLWRSLFETHIVCEFLCKHVSNVTLFQDYIAHTLLRSWLRIYKDANTWSKKIGTGPKYSQEQIDKLNEIKHLFEAKECKLSDDYGWTKSVLKAGRTFRDILNHVESDMSVFYRIASMEIHPTLGHRFAYSGLNLPLPAVPMSLFGIHDREEELQLDYVTAKVLHLITCRIDRFVSLRADMEARFEGLKRNGECALEERRRATSPIVPGSQRSVVRRRR